MEYFMGLRIGGCLTQSLHGQVHGCATNKSETQYTLYGQQRKIWIHCYDATICIPFPTKQNSILGSHCIRAFVLQDSVWCCEMDFWFYAVVPEENEEQFPTGGMLTDILHIQDIEIFGSQKHYDCPLLIYMHIFFIKRWRKSHLYDKSVETYVRAKSDVNRSTEMLSLFNISDLRMLPSIRLGKDIIYGEYCSASPKASASS